VWSCRISPETKGARVPGLDKEPETLSCEYAVMRTPDSGEEGDGVKRTSRRLISAVNSAIKFMEALWDANLALPFLFGSDFLEFFDARA